LDAETEGVGDDTIVPEVKWVEIHEFICTIPVQLCDNRTAKHRKHIESMT
jgi:hypothetical protein